MKTDILGRPHQSIPPTHYNTLGGIRSEYLLINGEWWLLSQGYQAVNKPVLATPIGEDEQVRSSEIKPGKHKHIKPVLDTRVVDPYAGIGRYKGD